MTAGIPTTPALDTFCRRAADMQSVRKAIAELAETGQLGQLERDIGAVRKSLGKRRARFVLDASGGPVLSPLAKATSSGYGPAALQAMLRAGTAFRLDGGHIAAVGTVDDLNYWITQAKGASGRGTPEDSAPFRAFLENRARALGVSQLIPAWGAAKSAARAAEYDRLALSVTDPAAAAGYRQLAKQARAVVSPAVLHVKAARYEQMAKSMDDPAMAESYRALARKTRAEAENVA